ncbi:DUF2505 domain-containing protein [Buchananella felis]|uniref:DUF2505 domain-containing protein n=1 Tax=Buchananella felis TaxID=3231492 RepID=UPI003528DA6B
MAQFTHVDSFAAPAARVGALLSSQELWRARQDALARWATGLRPSELGALPDLMRQLEGTSVLAYPNGASRLEFTMTVHPQALGDAASMVKAFLSGDLRAHVTEEWGAPAPDGSRTGRVEVRLDNPQVVVSAQASLYPTADGCQRRLSGDVTVNVPLLGGMLAGKATEHVGGLCLADAAVVRALL